MVLSDFASAGSFRSWPRLGDFFALVSASFVFFCYISIVIFVIMDLFRDDELDGWVQGRSGSSSSSSCQWITGLVYLIARGKGMAARSGRRPLRPHPREWTRYQPEERPPIRLQDIAKRQAFLAAGTISQGEFDALRARPW